MLRSPLSAGPTPGAFRTFWFGQTVSNLGNSFTFFALPLLVLRMTGSPLDLAMTTVAEFVPYALFGLAIGAWVDRLDRRRLMIACDAGRALVLASVPVAAAAGWLSTWWIYGVAFTTSTLGIAFTAAEFAAVKSLVPSGGLVAANGRIQASYQTANVLGPLLAGTLVGAGVPIAAVLAVDACSFLVSAATLRTIRVPFNVGRPPARRSVRAEVGEGLRYVFGHPVLRNISILAALANLFGVTIWTQILTFAKTRLAASDAEAAGMYAAGALGIAVLTLSAPLVRKVATFSVAALGALTLHGAMITALAFTRDYWVALILWALAAGFAFSFSVHTLALRQLVVPDRLFGRVMTVATVSAWSVNPIGAALGGWTIESTGSVEGVFGVLGGLILVTTSAFWFTALGRVDDSASRGDSPPVEKSAAPSEPRGELAGAGRSAG